MASLRTRTKTRINITGKKKKSSYKLCSKGAFFSNVLKSFSSVTGQPYMCEKCAFNESLRCTTGSRTCQTRQSGVFSFLNYKTETSAKPSIAWSWRQHTVGSTSILRPNRAPSFGQNNIDVSPVSDLKKLTFVTIKRWSFCYQLTIVDLFHGRNLSYCSSKMTCTQ